LAFNPELFLWHFQAALRARRHAGFQQWQWFLCRALRSNTSPQLRQTISSMAATGVAEEGGIKWKELNAAGMIELGT